MAVQVGSVNVRVSKHTRQQLVELAKTKGLSMQVVIDNAVEAYRRQAFLEGLNEDFTNLHANSQEWKEEQEERQLWEGTLSDGAEAL